MIIPHRKPRPEVIQLLAEQALDAMDTSGIDDMTAAEVLSACFTITNRVCKTMIEESSKDDLEHNIDQIQNAIGSLFALLPKGVVH